MKLKQKDRQVLISIDKLSQEMAEHAISNNKDKLIEEIEADILKSDKNKKAIPKPSYNTFIFFSSDSSEKQLSNISEKDNNSQSSNANADKSIDKNKEDNNEAKKNNDSPTKNLILLKDKNNPENAFSKKMKKVGFTLDNKQKNYEELNTINEIKENINNNSNRNNNTYVRNKRNTVTINKNINSNKKNNNIIFEENEFIDGNKIRIKNDKEDLEITLSPIYGNKGNDDDEINYYKLKSYIDKNKKKLQKKLYKGDKAYNTNSTGTFGDKKAINKNKTNNNLLKCKGKEDKENILINKSFTDRNKRINSLQNNYSNVYPKRKSSKKNVLNQKNGKTKSIDNISETDDKNNFKESSSSIDYSSKLNSSSSNFNSSHDFNLTTSSNNNIKNKNLLVNYSKNGRNSKYKNFLEKQLKRQRLAQLKINKIKREKELKEFKNYYSSPKINSLSLQIINSKGNYIPLFKRAIEIENEKKMKRLINQKIQNNNFIINNSNYTKRTTKEINDFFYAQMSWKDRVDQKNKYLKKLLIDQQIEQNSEITNYEMKINPKSELILLQKRKQNNLSLIDITQSNSTIIINSANRLYKDYEIRQKKLKKLKRELTPSFMPSINKSPKMHNYKNKKKNYRINANEQIKEVNDKDYDDSPYKYKYQSYNKGKNNRNSSKAKKSQKSRNPKGITNNLVSSRFFNKKENNLKSTAVDSRNTKSAQKVSSINNTKLEKIKEKDISNEYSHPNSNSTNKSIKIKNNKTNTTLNNLNNNSKNEENKNNKSNTKKTNSKISQSKESKSEESNTETSHNVTESEKESKNTKKEFSKSKEINKFSINEENKESKDNKDKKDNKDENNKENENSEKEEEKEMKTNKEINNRQLTRAITTRQKQNDRKEKAKPFKTFRRINSISNISPNIPREINNKNQIKKSINEVKFNKNNFIKGLIKPSVNRHKSVITKKTSELLLTNKYKDKLTPQLGISTENQNDTIEINNMDKGNYNLLNDFFTNKSNSKAKNNNNNIIKNSLYNDVDEIPVQPQKEDDFFDENFKSNITSEKKSEKKVVVKYRFDCTDDDENEEDEENEEKDEGGNESKSWIKKLKEISKNEEIKTDRDKDDKDEMNKKKKGASTTRSQTKRKTIDKEKDNINKNNEPYDDEKLYMLNLRNSSATGKLNPYTVTSKEQIFYKFFLKK